MSAHAREAEVNDGIGCAVKKVWSIPIRCWDTDMQRWPCGGDPALDSLIRSLQNERKRSQLKNDLVQSTNGMKPTGSRLAEKAA